MSLSLPVQIERLREETQRKIQEQEELLRQQMARGGEWVWLHYSL